MEMEDGEWKVEGGRWKVEGGRYWGVSDERYEVQMSKTAKS